MSSNMSHYEETRHPRGRDGKWVASISSPPAATLDGAEKAVVCADGNAYGYATVTRQDDGTYTVDRYTDQPVRAMGLNVTHQEQRTGLTEADARALAGDWAAISSAAPRLERPACRWCGCPTTLHGRRWYCDECGEQF